MLVKRTLGGWEGQADAEPQSEESWREGLEVSRLITSLICSCRPTFPDMFSKNSIGSRLWRYVMSPCKVGEDRTWKADHTKSYISLEVPLRLQGSVGVQEKGNSV